MDPSKPVLVCFAVREEAKFFSPLKVSPACAVLLTGIGRRNAERSLTQRLGQGTPALVVTSGSAGALDPARNAGDVLFEADEPLAARLQAAGAVPGRFHCADRVIVTAAEKAALRNSTGADAVEMESGAIRALCRERGIPAATVRVISDTATEDLPLDFNQLMTPDCELDYAKLARALVLSPSRLPALLRFQRRINTAARALADVLHHSLGGGGVAGG